MEAPILSCEGLSKSYGGRSTLNGVSFVLNAGNVALLVGSDTDGRTALIKLIAGLLVPDAGSINVCGIPPSPPACALISYLPDRNFLPCDMNVRELVSLYTRVFADFDAEKAKALLRELRVSTVKRMRELSKGTQKKVALILAVSRRARLYLFDAPTDGVDDATREYLLRLILSAHSPKTALLISTQGTDGIEVHADTLLVLSDDGVTASTDGKATVALSNEAKKEAT